MKRTQEELRKTEADLHDERRLFQSMLDHLPVSIIFARAPTGELFYSNNKFEEMWGPGLDTAKDIEAYDNHYLKAYHKDQTPYKAKDWPLSRSIMNGEVVHGEDTDVRYSDGRAATIRLSSTPVYDVKGEMIAALAICEDVTERIKIEELRTQLMAREQAALEASCLKMEFLRNMSHELRTPAHGILGLADLLVDDPDLTEKQRKLVVTIKESGKLLLMVINDILDFSKVEAGKLALEQTVVDIRFIFEHVGMISRTIAQKRGIEFKTDIASDLPQYLIGDPGRIQQILHNLTSNALKFTNRGSVTVRVEGELVDGNQCAIHFAVADTGIGISSENLMHLFQPFMQADSSTTRRYGGTGLGLSICKSLVDLMGGHISVQSAEGHGTTFSVNITLPMGDPPFPLSPLQEHDPDLLRPIRILVVEDNLINQKITTQCLKKLGAANIEVAHNGADAVEKFESGSYDIILMDVQMPVMDGYRATRLIREYENMHGMPRTPIIALTAGALKMDKDACYDAGMDDHIAKPFSQDELFDRMVAHLTKR